MAGFGDQNALGAADDGTTFASREFDHPRVQIVLPGPFERVCGRTNAAEIDETTLSLGDDLVFDDQDVAGTQPQAVSTQGAEKLPGNVISGPNLVAKRNRGELNSPPMLLTGRPGSLPAAFHKASGSRQASRPERTHSRASRWARVWPGREAICCKSEGWSTSTAMPGNRSTMHGLPIASAATRWGWKLSLPKRSGKRFAGRRKAALVPRPSPAGTSTVPSRGAHLAISSSSHASTSGMSAGMTSVLSSPRSTHTRVAISMAPVSPGFSESAMISKPNFSARPMAYRSLVTTPTPGRFFQS